MKGTSDRESEPMKRLTIDLPRSLHTRTKSQCAAEGITIADLVRKFLEAKFPESAEEPLRRPFEHFRTY